MNNTQNIQAWEALILTVKTGNISQTALLMGLDISKVSRLIAGLEEELGYPLLIKTKRPFKPTKKCEAIVDVADPLIKGFKQLEEYSKGVAKRSIFRIASPIEIAQEFYSEKLIAYSRTHPQINFEIVPEAEVEKLLTDEVDIIVANKRPTDESNLVIRSLFSGISASLRGTENPGRSFQTHRSSAEDSNSFPNEIFIFPRHGVRAS